MTFLIQCYRYIKLTRPLNVLIAMISVWIASIIAAGLQTSESLFLAIITTGLITAGANIINDLYDVDIDRVNKPDRLIAAGVVSTRRGWFYFALTYVFAFITAWFAGTALFVFALIFAVLLVWYSKHLKRVVLWGNILVSLSTGFAFIYGAMAVGQWEAGVIPGVFAFFFHFGREVIKDMQDVTGDREQMANTFPVRFGIRRSVYLVNIIFGVLIILTLIPYILDIYDKTYLFVVLTGVDTVLVFVSVSLWKTTAPSSLGQISHLLKLDMFIGLLAIFLG